MLILKKNWGEFCIEISYLSYQEIYYAERKSVKFGATNPRKCFLILGALSGYTASVEVFDPAVGR